MQRIHEVQWRPLDRSVSSLSRYFNKPARQRQRSFLEDRLTYGGCLRYLVVIKLLCLYIILEYG